MVVKLILLILVSALYGCSETLSECEDYTIVKIEEAFENNEAIRLSKYASSIEYLPLETTLESSLADILELRSDKYNLYIKDDKFMNIKVFDKSTGKFVKLFDKKGRGPGEYLYCHTFDIKEYENQEDNQLVISGLGSVYGYSLKDDRNVYQFEKPRRIVNRVACSRTDDSIYLIYNKSAQEKGLISEDNYWYQYLYQFNKEGRIISESYIGVLMGTHAITAKFVPYKDKLRVINVTEDTIYNVNNDNSLSIEYIVDFGKYQHFQTVDKKDGSWYFEFTDGGTYENDSFLLFKSDLPEIALPHLYKRHPDYYRRIVYHSIILYDKKEKKTYSIKEDQNYDYIGFVNDIDGGVPFSPRYVEGNKMYQFINAADFIELAERHNVPRMKEIAATLTEESNPVMVVATLK